MVDHYDHVVVLFPWASNESKYTRATCSKDKRSTQHIYPPIKLFVHEIKPWNDDDDDDNLWIFFHSLLDDSSIGWFELKFSSKTLSNSIVLKKKKKKNHDNDGLLIATGTKKIASRYLFETRARVLKSDAHHVASTCTQSSFNVASSPSNAHSTIYRQSTTTTGDS